jgi:hypothetical protein
MKKHDILELSKMSHEDLLTLADEHGIDARNMSKQVLMYEILDAQQLKEPVPSAEKKEVYSLTKNSKKWLKEQFERASTTALCSLKKLRKEK